MPKVGDLVELSTDRLDASGPNSGPVVAVGENTVTLESRVELSISGVEFRSIRDGLWYALVSP